MPVQRYVNRSGPHYSWQTLIDWVTLNWPDCGVEDMGGSPVGVQYGNTYDNVGMPIMRWTDMLNMHRNGIRRRALRGWVDAWEADEIAIKVFGVHPSRIWPQWWDDALKEDDGSPS